MSFFPFFFWRPNRKNSGRKASWWRRASAPNARRTACAVIPTVPRFYLPFFFRYLFWAGSFPSWQGQTFTCDWHPGWGGRTNQLWIAGSPPNIFPLKVLALFFVGRILEVKHCWTKWIFLEWNLHPWKWTWNPKIGCFVDVFSFSVWGLFLENRVSFPGCNNLQIFLFHFLLFRAELMSFEAVLARVKTWYSSIIVSWKLEWSLIPGDRWSSYICYMLYDVICMCIYLHVYMKKWKLYTCTCIYL